jgi:hypothetical protein
MGLSATTLKYITPDTLQKKTGDVRDEIPYVAYLASNNPAAEESERDPETGRAPVYKKMAYDRWVSIKGVHNAAEKVNKKIHRKFDTDGAIVAGVKYVVSGQKRKPIVNIKVQTIEKRDGKRVSPDISPGSHDSIREKVDNNLPDKVDGEFADLGTVVEDVEIQVTEMVKPEQTHNGEYLYDCDEYDVEYRPIQGGCQAGRGFDGADFTLGTLTHDSGDTPYIVSCSHCVDDNVGVEVEQPDGGNRIGESDQVQNVFNFDACTIELDDPSSAEYGIADEWGGSERGIDGTLTWSELQTMEDNAESLNKQGEYTCRSSGEVVSLYESYSNGYKDVHIDGSTADSHGGDSGGPYYDVAGAFDYAYIAAIHAWGTTNPSGTAMVSIEDEFNVYVTPE